MFSFSKINSGNLALSFFLALMVTVLPDIAAASTVGSISGIEKIVCRIIVILQGDFARGVAAIALIFLGFSLFLGKVSWGVALAIGIGLGAVFGAAEIVDAISSGSSLKASVDNDCA